MKIFLIFLSFLIFSLSYGKNKNQSDTAIDQQFVSGQISLKEKFRTSVDTIKHFAEKEGIIYALDTLLNEVRLRIKTYCLNDSAIFQRVITDLSKYEKNIVEISVSHNYAAEIEILKSNERIKVIVTKEAFCDSLSEEFMNISNMWSNEFFNYENENFVFYAKLAEPDTDYQYGIYYTITNDGKIKILKVENESYDGSEEDD